MAQVSPDNRKYIFQKRLQEALTAWGFLLPNLIGFLLITFFPIFFTFYLAFTEWDGLSYASPAKVRVAFKRTTEATNTTITIRSGTKLSVKTRKVGYKDAQIPITYKILQDIVLTPEENTLSLGDMNALRQWTFYTNERGQILDIVSEKLPKDVPPVKEGDLFFSRTEIMSANLRWETPVEGVAIGLDLTKPGHEIVVRSTKNERVTIPAGTTIVADMFLKLPEAPRDREWFFELPQGTTIPAGKIESAPISVQATETGEMGSETSLLGMKLKIEPAVEGVEAYIKFVQATGNNGLQFVGLRNFQDILLRDTRFKEYLFNTFIFLLGIPLGMMVSLIMALAMNMPLKGIVAFRVMYFLPVISNIVAVALVWRWFLNPDYGIINGILRTIGISNPPNWLGDKTWAKVSIIVVDVWKGAGYNMMLYLAGLQGISQDFYEAAEIDGATPWQQFWHITWPLLSPTNFFIFVMGIIGGFQAFGTQYALTGGGPAGATTTIVYYVYNNAFKWGKMGYASAIAVILFGLVMIATLLQWIFTEKNVEY